MSEPLALTFETGELLRRARVDGKTMAYLAIAFANERGMLDDFLEYVGLTLAQSWNGLRGPRRSRLCGRWRLTWWSWAPGAIH